MSTPGWYPDPQDANQLRYYDGQNWTEHRQATPGQPQAAAEPHAGTGEQAQPAQSGGWAPTQQFEQSTADPGWGAQAAAPTEPYWGGAGASTAPSAQPSWGTPAGAAWQQQGQYPPAAPSGRSRTKVPLIIALVVIVVAGLATGGYFLFFNKGNSPEFTFAGKEIKQPDAVLKTAEKNLAGIVSTRHGARSKQTRCYYAQPKDPAEGAKKSDVAKDLYCGPVLFVDGDPSQPYLQFALSSAAEGGKPSLTPSATPESNDPASVPNSVTLKRPDGATAPKGSAGLKAPAPPPADKDVLLAATLTSVTVPDAPDTAVLGSWSGGIRITKLGTIKRYGHGDDARSAPDGEKLLAFQTTGATGAEDESEDLTSKAEISVDGGSGKQVPALSSGQYVVVAVPTDAKSVDLVVDDEGLTQSISLLDGKPGKDNVLLFTRSNRDGTTPVSASGVLTFKPKVKFDDGSSGTSETARVTVNKVELFYRTPVGEKQVTARSPRNALMHVSVTYDGAHEHGEYGFPSSMVTFTPSGGKAVRARNLSLDPDNKIYSTFEVPADVTSGTLTVSGAINQTYSGGDGHYRFGVKHPISMKISIPTAD
jgi:hypothetical protein